MAEIRRLLSYVTPYWRRITGALVCLTLSSLITLALPYGIQQLVDSIFVTRSVPQLNLLSIVLLGLFLLQAIVSFTYRFLMQYVAQRGMADLRLRTHQHLLELPLRFFTNRRTGDIISRISNDITTLQDTLVNAPISLLRQFITVLGGVALMLWFNWQLTLIILALIAPLTAVATIYSRRLKSIATNVQDRQADAAVVLEEMLSGIRVVKSFVRESYERLRYGEAIEESFRSSVNQARQRATFVALISLLGFSAIIVLIWFGGRDVIAGKMTPGELIGFLFYMMFVSSSLAETANLWGRLVEATGASRRVFEILAEQPEFTGTNRLSTVQATVHNGTEPNAPHSVNGRPAHQQSAVRGHVRFDNVHFSYRNHQQDGDVNTTKQNGAGQVVLNEIDLEAKPGQVMALVGYSGSGKTTLVNLIPRFYDPTAGQIELDGRNIRDMPLEFLRSQIALVPQETFLFGGTVFENIAYGRLDATESEIHAAAEAAYAHEFIAELPSQYETIVGERGIKLSAGQRQRIAIARALLKDPRLLILDEATSALDTESERWVQAALERLMQGRTSFVIAHRLSTIQNADVILAMERGRIVERGTHAALLAQDGLYRKLYQTQIEAQEAVPSDPVESKSFETSAGNTVT